MCCKIRDKIDETEPHNVKETKDILLTLCQRDVRKRKRAGLCKDIAT